MLDEDKALDVDYTPAGAELTDIAGRNLSRWLDYVRNNPPLTELQQKADAIMDAIQVASGLVGLETLAAELALAVDHRFIRLGLLHPWYTKLMSLYDPFMGKNHWFQAGLLHMLVQQFLHDGDVRRARQLIDPSPEASADILDWAAVEASLVENEKGRLLAERLLTLAHFSDDQMLMARAYSVLAQFYVNQGNPARVFECGQMVSCIGTAIADETLIVHGLHFMAIGFTMENQPARAIPILEVAITRAARSGDNLEMNYLHYTWGLSAYLLGHYQEAESHFEECVRIFANRGEFFARTSYMYGLSLIKLSRPADAERALQVSLAAWNQLRRPFDALYTQHGLAHVHWMMGRTAEAVNLARMTLKEALLSKNLRRDGLVAELRKDLKRYKKPYDPATGS